jgi:hypothetical protein
LGWVNQQGEILAFLAMKMALHLLAQIDEHSSDITQLAAQRGSMSDTLYNHLDN